MGKPKVKELVVISDTHFGSSLALANRHRLDDGGFYEPSPLQLKLHGLWEDFWEWIYDHLDGAPFVLIHNGDIIDGNHHHTTTLSSANTTVQQKLAIDMLKPHVKRAEAFYVIRGTEAHGGQSGSDEEMIAKTLEATPDEETGQYARWEMWMKFNRDLIHFAHHIGTTSSMAYESSAVMREIVAAFVEAGQWNQRPPSILVRSHRHRYIEVKPPCGRAVVTPGWQAKTPFVFKMDRMRAPMFGGLLLRGGDEGTHIRERIYTLDRSTTVEI